MKAKGRASNQPTIGKEVEPRNMEIPSESKENKLVINCKRCLQKGVRVRSKNFLLSNFPPLTTAAFSVIDRSHAISAKHTRRIVSTMPPQTKNKSMPEQRNRATFHTQDVDSRSLPSIPTTQKCSKMRQSESISP